MSTNLTFLQAVAREEGFYINGNRPERNHNPGDIEAGRFATAHGAIGSDGKFAIFADDAAGWAAMKALFEAPSYIGLTVEQALNRWAPPNEPGQDSNYVTNVCRWVGCQPSDPIAPLVTASV